MLIVDLYLVSCDLPKHLKTLAILLQAPRAFANRRWRWLENGLGAILLIASICYAYAQIHDNVLVVNEQLADFIRDRQINRKGQWNVKTFQLDGKDVTNGVPSRMYFDLWHTCLFLNGEARMPCTFQVDRGGREIHILSLTTGDDDSPITGTYKVNGDILTVSGKQQKHDVELILSRDHWGR
jgi:hypothetical protein